MVARWIVLFVALIGLIGCGGGGKSGPSAAPFLSIYWPERSKATVNGPSSALSVVVTCTSLENGAVSTYSGDRGSDLSAFTTNVVCNNKLPLNQTIQVNVTFYAQTIENGKGAVVGAAAQTDAVISNLNGTLVDSTGAALNVSIATTVQTVSVTENSNPVKTATVGVGQTLTLGFAAFDASSNLVAVTQGSGVFQSLSPGIASVTPLGVVTGVAAGTANIQCTIDGVAGTVAVTVTPAPVAPMATVDWGARSRTVALTSAESVSVTVTSGTQTSTGTANRDLTQLQQTAQVVTLGTALPVGTVTVSATFYDQPNETGDVVGTYTNTTTTLQASGTLVSAGQQLAITANPVIRRVVISPPTTVAPNATEQLTFTAYDINNNPLPQVSAGSATFTAAGGQSFISVTSYGLVTGNSAGSQTVTCTIDGVTSSPVTVTVS